jgi:hypothetical protein
VPYAIPSGGDRGLTRRDICPEAGPKRAHWFARRRAGARGALPRPGNGPWCQQRRSRSSPTCDSRYIRNTQLLLASSPGDGAAERADLLPLSNVYRRFAVDHLRRLSRYGAVVAAVLLTAFQVPVAAQTTADQTTPRDDDGFDDWGLLGLLGLAGLLGRKRNDRDRNETRRV